MFYSGKTAKQNLRHKDSTKGTDKKGLDKWTSAYMPRR
jgi:hypothetical protein